MNASSEVTPSSWASVDTPDGVPATERLARLLAGAGDRPRQHAWRMAELVRRLLVRPPTGPLLELLPGTRELQVELARAATRHDPDCLEEALLQLYEHLHLTEAPYTRAERTRMDAAGGYWCHAGGLSPILHALPWISPDTVSADLGAGNGLQGLLLQVLRPHRRTLQVEISSGAVEIGRQLQAWLGVPEAAVEWVVADLLEPGIVERVVECDLLLLYRPVRPERPGDQVYRRLAATLASSNRQTVVLSVADCLRRFLPDGFLELYGDGQLTVLQRRT